MALIKEEKYKNKKITGFARGRSCTLRLPGVCKNRVDTCVWAHSNRLSHGKGKGTKAHDIFGCVACFECHAVLDGAKSDLTRERIEFEFDRARDESLLNLLLNKVIV
jgi:hypothetical protein